MNIKVIIFRELTEHIGQMPIAMADSEIQRMEEQTGLVWRKDFSPFLEDEEIQYEGYPPARLSPGNCWVVVDYKDSNSGL